MEAFLFNNISNYISLSEEEKETILSQKAIKTYTKGTAILKEGQVSDFYYFIIKGVIRCYYIIDGEEKTTAFYTENEVFFPQCSATGKPAEHYISCVEDSVIIISNQGFEEIMCKKFPRFEKLFYILSKQSIAEIQFSFDSYKISSPEQRYLNLLQLRSDLLQRVPLYQMASYLGITPQSLSRLRRRLVNSGKL